MTTTQDQQPKFTLQRRRQAVQFFVEPLTQDFGIEMMQIPAGTFLMGSSENELDRLEDESPQHEVNVATFFMGKYPITQEQWRAVAELPQVERGMKADPSRFKGDMRPVEQVSWYDAVEFCARLSQHTGREYRLPTEAEWEYACRAGTTTPFHFGETITTDLANYRGTAHERQKMIITDLANYRGTAHERQNWSGSYGEGPKGEYRAETMPVDYFGVANGFGLCDMHGNVFEWCEDHWHSNYEGAPVDGSAWLSDDDTASRVIRGGSWDNGPRTCRSAYRNNYAPVNTNDDFGFRVVCSAPRTFK